MEKAADAAKAVIDLGIYKLYAPFPDNPVQNYAAQFYTRDYTETILQRILSNSTDIDGNYLPNGSPLREMENLPRYSSLWMLMR